MKRGEHPRPPPSRAQVVTAAPIRIQVASLGPPSNDVRLQVPANDVLPGEQALRCDDLRFQRLADAAVAPVPPDVSRRFVDALADLLVADLTRRRQ